MPWIVCIGARKRKKAALKDLLRFEESLGIDQMCISINISVYCMGMTMALVAAEVMDLTPERFTSLLLPESPRLQPRSGVEIGFYRCTSAFNDLLSLRRRLHNLLVCTSS